MNDNEIYEYEIRRLKEHIQYLEDRNFIYREEKIKYQERILKAREELFNNDFTDSDFEGMRFQNYIDSILKGDHVDGK